MSFITAIVLTLLPTFVLEFFLSRTLYKPYMSWACHRALNSKNVQFPPLPGSFDEQRWIQHYESGVLLATAKLGGFHRYEGFYLLHAEYVQIDSVVHRVTRCGSLGRLSLAVSAWVSPALQFLGDQPSIPAALLSFFIPGIVYVATTQFERGSQLHLERIEAENQDVFAELSHRKTAGIH